MTSYYDITNPSSLTLTPDKYTQVARILQPLVLTLKEIDSMIDNKNAALLKYIEGSFPNLKKDILYDFFRNAFDGSGADNFFDAGK